MRQRMDTTINNGHVQSSLMRGQVLRLPYLGPQEAPLHPWVRRLHSWMQTVCRAFILNLPRMFTDVIEIAELHCGSLECYSFPGKSEF